MRKTRVPRIGLFPGGVGQPARSLASPFAARGLKSRTACVIVCVMNTKLTLRLDDVLVEQAKAEAAQRGKSVSQMFAEFVSLLAPSSRKRSLPPVTRSLLGIMKDHRLSEEDCRSHLREKYS